MKPGGRYTVTIHVIIEHFRYSTERAKSDKKSECKSRCENLREMF